MRPRRTRTILATVAALGLIAAAGAVALVWSGAYNVAASSQHTQPVYSLLERAMQQSVQLRANDIRVPPLNAPDMIARGAACYRSHCEQCHGGPGVAQQHFALGMQPLPGPLVNAPTRWKAPEVYWIIEQGITMSGMPAWRYRLSESDMWSIVAFVEQLHLLSATQYRATMERVQDERCDTLQNSQSIASNGDAGGDASRGRSALSQYGCNGCHRIPGITGSHVNVGPPLAGIARRQLIAGRLANTADNMTRWLRDPKKIDPLTTMPALGVTEHDARDIAAYLATLL
jgi:mono/diheme cytochrome c family protein